MCAMPLNMVEMSDETTFLAIEQKIEEREECKKL